METWLEILIVGNIPMLGLLSYNRFKRIELVAERWHHLYKKLYHVRRINKILNLEYLLCILIKLSALLLLLVRY